MSRPRKKFANKEAQEKHEKALARRRALHRDNATIRMATKAALEGADGVTDMEALIEAEKRRQETPAQTMGRKGGAQPPKVTAAARDNLAAAFDYMGGVPALVVWGRANPTEFYRIWARLIPRESAETSAALPLEALLEKLATREEQSVGQAAREIGEELIAEGKRAAELEDLSPNEIN